MRRYDTTFIIDGNLGDAERLALIEKYAGMLKKLGGDIEQIVRWGLRTLAYTINKRTHGYYVIFYYRANPSIISAFERELRLNENILRYMSLISDAKHPEYIRDEGASAGEIVIPDAPETESESEIAEGGIDLEDTEDEETLDEIDENETESDINADDEKETKE